MPWQALLLGAPSLLRRLTLAQLDSLGESLAPAQHPHTPHKLIRFYALNYAPKEAPTAIMKIHFWVEGAADLQVCIVADDGVLQVAAVLDLHAVHEDTVDDLHIAAQLAHGTQHAALYGALVRHCRSAPHLPHSGTALN